MTSRKGLLDAIRHLDVDEVRAALAERPALARVAEADGQTPLHRCARVLAPGGDPGLEAVAIARLLLDAGAEVDALRRIPDERRPFEATPLWYAVEQGRNPGVIDLLLARGADPGRVLWSVCFNEDLATADKLLAAGLDVGRLGASVILATIHARRKRSLAWLLAQGARVDVVDELGRGVLHHAVEAKLPMAELKALIGAGARVDLPDAHGDTPADLARAQGRSRVAGFLERLA